MYGDQFGEFVFGSQENSNLGHCVNTSQFQAFRLWGQHKEIM